MFSDLILGESKTLRSLHAKIQETAKTRDESPSAREAHYRACRDFHSYESLLWPYIQRVYEDQDYRDAETVEFVVTFLELDARFFRSGYIKEKMLEKVGRADLDKKQLRRLRSVLVDSVRNRGGREFRRYCRLAAKIWDNDLSNQLNNFALEEGAIGARAKMMRSYIEQEANGT